MGGVADAASVREQLLGFATGSRPNLILHAAQRTGKIGSSTKFKGQGKMKEVWTHKATIWSAVLLIDEETDLNLLTLDGPQPRISFSVPKRLEHPIWATWDNVIPLTTWEYIVTFRFEAEDDVQALDMAHRNVEALVARLAFFATAPVEILSYGSLTNAPDVPVPGASYKSISISAEQAMEITAPVISSENIKHLTELLLSDRFQKEGHERVERSMRWLEHSRLARTPIEEFTCLIIAFENLGNLLEEPIERYWHCDKCGKDTTGCPYCGKSTKWQGSANTAMRNFVCDVLGWPKDRWEKLWKLRNKILHGTSDLTLTNQLQVLELLNHLEAAVINAIRYTLHTPIVSPPHSLRPRNLFNFANLHINWTAPNKKTAEADDNPGGS